MPSIADRHLALAPFAGGERHAFRPRWLQAVLLATAAVSALGASPAFAEGGLPGGPSVVSGTANIASTGSAMTVTQGSDRAIVNWQSFNVGQGNSVNFVQPGINAAILNRVTGNTRSSIAGAISGNGQVFLVNPNGIAITPTGTVKAGGGFVASTLDITDDDFMSGNMVYRGNGASSTVSNKGVVTIGRGGYVALMGGKVKNSGLIAVPYGKAGLGAGEEVTLDLSGDGFMQVAVPSSLIDDGEALVENSGTVTAEGGVIVMKAATARAAARNAVNLSGVAEARSVSGRNGKITLGGGAGGKVRVSGTVSTRAKAAQPKTTEGGAIEITGLEIRLDDAVIDASGYAAGGKVRIGGDWQGAGDIPHADILTVSAGTMISADAVSQGTGGSVVLWSDTRTDFAGQISATGATGTGGDVEVSGKALLSYTGFADLTGAAGFGSLLLDPYNVTISNAADQTSSGFTASGNDSVINVATLQNALAGANVTVSTGAGGSQDGDITVADAVTWTSGSTLTLSAYRNIAVNANLAGGAGSKIVLRADSSATGSGTVSFGSGITATADGGVSLYYNPASYSAPVDYSTNAGSGTMLTAYMLVNTLGNLQAINATTSSLAGTYALGTDIDASATAGWNGGAGFEPIGNGSSQFTGTFDGEGHVITGLTINRSDTDYVGLFGSAGSGSILRNVGLVGGSVSGSGYVGGLAGYNYGKISNAYATGSVSGGSYYVGGLVGFNDDGTISNAYATGSVSGGGDVGGLVGFNNDGTITASYFDTDTTKQSNGVGGGSAAGVTGLTTAEARTQAGYTGFDFDNTWYQAGDMRPILRSEAAAPVDGVITVSNLHQLALMGADLSASYRLSGDIDASATDAAADDYDASGIWGAGGFVPIGTSFSSAFAGTFDGDGHVIRGLAINRPGTDYVGLFGLADSRSILRNVGLDGGIVTGNLYFGGLVGVNAGTISNAYATGSVMGSGDFVGGLVGFNRGTISNAYATGSVAGGSHAGGLVGYNEGGTINNAYATGIVTGGYDVGGLVGYNDAGTISNAYATGRVTGSGYYAGGLVGYNDRGTISNAYATGSVSSPDHVGGLVGGTLSGTISYAYATGSVTGGSYVGGLVGSNSGAKITASYFDTDTTNQSNGVGSGDGEVTGLTTEEFQDTAEFYARALAGWNFETVWAPPSEGYYPELYALSDVVFVKTDGQTITYGDAPGTLTYSVYGGHSGAGVFAPTLTTDATATSNVGSYAITGQSSLVGDDGITYRTVYGPGAVTINRAPLRVTANSGSMIYGDDVPGDIGYTATGWKNGQTSALLTGVSVDTNATKTSNAGTGYATTASGGTLSGAAAGNYAISYVGSGFEVNKAPLRVTADSGSMIYGDDVPGDIGYTATGWKNGQTSALLTGVSVGTNATKTSNVGTGYATIASGGTLSGAAAGNYAISYVGGGFAVNKAELTVTANSGTMSYGSTPPTDLGYTVSGWKNSDIGSVTGASVVTDAMSTSNVGSGYVTTASGGMITSTAAGNYVLSYAPGSFSVTPRALKIRAKGASKTYGEVASLTAYSVNGLVNGDTVSTVTLTSAGSAASANAATYDIIASNATGSGLSNYAIDYVDGALTVAKAKLTVTADNGSMIYGDAVPMIGYAVSGWKNGQSDAFLVGVIVTTNANPTSNVGTYYSTMAAGGQLGGAAFGNYTLDHVDGKFAVTPRALTVTASDAVKTYGDTASLTGFTTTGLVNGDSVAAVSEKSLGADAEADSGVYDIIASAAKGTGLSNYDINYEKGTLTVDKAALTVTADSGSMIYGDAVPMIGYAVSGWKNGQNGPLLSGVFVTTDATSSSDVGSGYSTAAFGGALSGAAAGNYDISYVAGSMAIQRRAITVVADAGAKIYGDLGLLTYTVGGMGLANGDRLSGKLESDGQAMLANVGSYAVTQGSVTDAFNRNYAISYRANTLAVMPRPITLIADDAVKQLGTQAGVMGWQVTAGNLVDGGASLNGSPASRGAPTSATVGTYAITAGSLTDAENPNYAITFLPGKLQVMPVLAPSAPAGGVPLPGQQFDPFTVAGGSLQEALLADNINPPGTLTVTSQSPVSNAACDAGPQILFICP
ncbi:hypothetical protein TM49_09545 [Martelella endophytica]|uniref:Filamentous haemagglutinin FhaB/tRNA nuclease CdiA-like TPS domain-containing protein n=2 Tax=Martelella endophytica TaxID=1486262 RepID=A0A0D5LPM4_MAREN|nr:hypothetical protein TM49_09545 [Martelella endophytica]